MGGKSKARLREQRRYSKSDIERVLCWRAFGCRSAYFLEIFSKKRTASFHRQGRLAHIQLFGH